MYWVHLFELIWWKNVWKLNDNFRKNHWKITRTRLECLMLPTSRSQLRLHMAIISSIPELIIEVRFPDYAWPGETSDFNKFRDSRTQRNGHFEPEVK